MLFRREVSIGDKPATPAEEKEQVAKVWKESYAGLEGVPVVIDTETMVRYGASATLTFVLRSNSTLRWTAPWTERTLGCVP